MISHAPLQQCCCTKYGTKRVHVQDGCLRKKMTDCSCKMTDCNRKSVLCGGYVCRSNHLCTLNQFGLGALNEMHQVGDPLPIRRLLKKNIYTLFLRKRKGTPGIFHSNAYSFAFLVNAKDLAVLYNWEQLLNVSPLVKISILAILVQQRKNRKRTS